MGDGMIGYVTGVGHRGRLHFTMLLSPAPPPAERSVMATRFARSVLPVLGILLLPAILTSPATAQTTEASEWKLRQQAADSTIRVIAGDITSTSLKAATDMANLLARRNGLRLVPIAGQGGADNISDLLYLRDIDLTIVSLDALERMNAENLFPNLDRRVAYVAKLFNEEVHVIVREGTTDIGALAGRKIGVGPKGSSGDYSARTIFETAGVPYEGIHGDYATALMQLKQGELDAVVMVSGKPMRTLEGLADGKLRLMPVKFDVGAMPNYLPATLSASDYPGLVPEGESIETIATQNVLLAFNWKQDTSRYKKVATFIDQLFPHAGELVGQANHPKWREFNLSARLPEWKRVDAATQAVEQLGSMAAAPQSCSPADLRAAVDQYLAEANIKVGGEISKADAEKLFIGFQEWVKTQPVQQ
jgi:TRAP-type uncharacterized transport system substrate-binding protein